MYNITLCHFEDGGDDVSTWNWHHFTVCTLCIYHMCLSLDPSHRDRGYFSQHTDHTYEQDEM